MCPVNKKNKLIPLEQDNSVGLVINFGVSLLFFQPMFKIFDFFWSYLQGYIFCIIARTFLT